ncbi:retrotransposon hot spot protein [Nitzschia inconspicua]|uniref:Retrotransposon hot spot protein n=1 Tax=Nitzschia inconspicua TaxID=303405 RepID=A0A9K3PW97_9STRA|nr:retrotransposon hot spot protein [Nitzschia inconspicua]
MASTEAAKIALQILVMLVFLANFWTVQESFNIDTDIDKTVVEEMSNPVVKQANPESPLPQYGNSSWCPQSVCHSSPMCQPCKRRFLIIFSTGRSASTTLTWMMDSLPGVRMSGENNNLLKNEFYLYNTTFEKEHFGKSIGKRNSFGRNQILPGSLSCILQNTIELITPPTFPINDTEEEQSTIIGFKTVRSHIAVNDDEMRLFVHFLQENLPCARYLINYRSDVQTHVHSLKTNFYWTGNITNQIGEENDDLMLLYKLLGPQQAHLLDSTKWTKNQSSTIIGFKTIRAHTAKNRNEMEAFVKFLKEHLPCTRYLINYRSDTEAHLKSLKEAFKWERTIAEKQVENEFQNLKLMYELLGPDLSYMLDSSEWTKDVRILNKALDWLGFGQDCHFPSLLEFNTMRYKHTKQTFENPFIFANCTGL